MTTPSGAIKFSDITTEFGTPTGKNLGAFRVNQTIAGQSWPLDTGVPTSGAISFSQLRGKTLNVVIDSGTGTDEYNVTLTSYFPSQATAVGGFYTLPGTLASLGSKKYNVCLRKSYGGSAAVTASVKSGSWPSGSTLNVIVTNSATIWGRGGDGGYGGVGSGSYGSGGGAGLNSIGFSYSANLTVNSGSSIIAGFGGGGGGGGSYSNPDPGPYDPAWGGGGGGGGQGNPGGNAGSGGYAGNPGTPGSPGGGGSKTSGGNGGGQGCQPSINGSGGGGGGGGGITFGSGGKCPSNPGFGAGGANGSISGGGSGGGTGGGGGGDGAAILQNGVTVTVNNSGYCYPSATPVNGSFT